MKIAVRFPNENIESITPSSPQANKWHCPSMDDITFLALETLLKLGLVFFASGMVVTACCGVKETAATILLISSAFFGKTFETPTSAFNAHVPPITPQTPIYTKHRFHARVAFAVSAILSAAGLYTGSGILQISSLALLVFGVEKNLNAKSKVRSEIITEVHRQLPEIITQLKNRYSLYDSVKISELHIEPEQHLKNIGFFKTIRDWSKDLYSKGVATGFFAFTSTITINDKLAGMYHNSDAICKSLSNFQIKMYESGDPNKIEADMYSISQRLSFLYDDLNFPFKEAFEDV